MTLPLAAKISSSIGVLVCGAVLTGCGHTALTANSSCKDFLNASPQDQYSAVNRIAASMHAGNAVTPLGRPNVDYICTNSPSTTLGTAIKETG